MVANQARFRVVLTTAHVRRSPALRASGACDRDPVVLSSQTLLNPDLPCDGCCDVRT
jgi:hypothetical protein